MSVKRQTLWSMAPLLVVTVLNLVSVPLFYRFLGADLYALISYVATLRGSFGFADLGLGVAVGRYVGVELGRGDLEAARSYWGTGNAIAIPLLLVMALAFTFLGFVFGPRWFNVDPGRHASRYTGDCHAGFSHYNRPAIGSQQRHASKRSMRCVRSEALGSTGN